MQIRLALMGIAMLAAIGSSTPVAASTVEDDLKYLSVLVGETTQTNLVYINAVVNGPGIDETQVAELVDANANVSRIVIRIRSDVLAMTTDPLIRSTVVDYGRATDAVVLSGTYLRSAIQKPETAQTTLTNSALSLQNAIALHSQADAELSSLTSGY